MIFNRWLLGLMGTALLGHTLAFALKFGWGGALGVVLFGLGAGFLLAPGLRANEGRRLTAFLFNLAAVLVGLVMDNRTSDTLGVLTTAVVVMLLWDGEGPNFKKRWLAWRHKQLSRFARPVISLPS